MLVTQAQRKHTGVKQRASFLLWCVTLMTSITNGNISNRFVLTVKLNYYMAPSLKKIQNMQPLCDTYGKYVWLKCYSEVLNLHQFISLT